MQPLFQALYNADADVILGGHAHDYERFAPQNPSGQLDNARGIRQFVVGTGGAFWTSVGTPKPNSQIRQNNTYGVLKLTLHPTSYDWQFVSESNKPFTDSGTGQCHGSQPPPPSDTTKPTAPGSLDRDRELGPGRAELERLDRQRGRHRLQGVPRRHGDREPRQRDLLHRHDRRRKHHLQLHGARDGCGREPVRSQQHSHGHDARHDEFHDPRRGRRPGGAVHARRPTTPRPICARTAAPTRAADSFLRFTVAGVAGSVQNAKLRIHAYTATADGPAVYTTSNSWAENTLTWNTRPLRTSAATDDKGAIASNTWVEYNVTPFVTGNGTYSFTIAQTSSDGVDFRAA